MRLRRLADGFMIGGATLGILAAIGYAADIVPDLPPAILKLVLYKLTFIGGLGLVVFGAFLRRIASRGTQVADDTSAAARARALGDAEPRPALREPAELDGRWEPEAREPAPARERRKP